MCGVIKCSLQVISTAECVSDITLIERSDVNLLPSRCPPRTICAACGCMLAPPKQRRNAQRNGLAILHDELLKIMATNKHSKLLVCASGIFVCYFYFGMLQEKITRGQYGDENNREKFTYMFALVFVQCVVNYVFAKTILLTVMKQGEDTTSTLYYSLSALTYLLAMVCSNMALKFVSYPTQVIAKSGKPIPVMILGVLLGKKV